MRKKKNDVKIIGIIPARGGSKGIPHKNIAPLLGKPLIVHAIEAAKRSKLLDAFLVSTDDPKIAEVARLSGADVPFLRPKSLSGDRARDIEFLQHALAWLLKNRGWKPEIVVLLQPTSPGRTGKDIDDVISFLLKEKADSVRTMIDPGHFDPFKMWIETGKGGNRIRPMLSITSYKKMGADVPRQLLPRFFLPFGLVYVTRAKFIRRGKVWGDDMRYFLMPKERIIDINVPEDLEEAELKLRKPR